MSIISMNKKYKTRNGFPVRILCVDKKGAIPVLGLMDKGEAEYQMSWLSNGRVSQTVENELDLIECHPLEDLPIDTPIWVRYGIGDPWVPRHFSHIDNGHVACWENGSTSHTCEKGAWASWCQYSLSNPNA